MWPRRVLAVALVGLAGWQASADGDTSERVASKRLKEMMLSPCYPAPADGGLAIHVEVLSDCVSRVDPVLDLRVTLEDEQESPLLVNPDLCYGFAVEGWLTPPDDFVRLTRTRVAKPDPYRPDSRDLFALQPGRRLQRDLAVPVPVTAFERRGRMDVVVDFHCYYMRELDPRAWEGNLRSEPVQVEIHRTPDECNVENHGIEGRNPGTVEQPTHEPPRRQ